MQKKYMLVYTGGKMPESEADQKRELKDWESWYTKIGKAVVDQGNPFTPMAKNITPDGRISDGTMDCLASGYSLIQADSIDAAVALARSCPVLKDGAKITVYETFNAQGM
jgi:hypothetical protein